MEDIVIGELTLVNFNSNDKTHLMTLKKLVKDTDITSRFNGFLQHLNNKNSNFFNKGFFVRDEENLIGYIDLSNFNEEEKAVYIRQAIFNEYRGNKEKRYGTLLLNEITDYLFSNYPMIHYIKARIHHDNLSSMKMAWNCGFSNDEEIFSKENPYIKNKLK